MLPVTTSKHVTWDRVTWKVQDESDTKLLEKFCQTACQDMFSVKVDTAGVHSYSVEMRNGGKSVTCDSRLRVLGKIR